VLRIGSLFSGIGGLDLGLERSGLGKVIWNAEILPRCRKILKKHWPEAKQFINIKEVTKESADSVDLLCGGFPCQDISRAGKQEGIAGSKSKLWKEYYRVIQELRPKLVIIENVSDLIRLGLADILQDLAQIGYDAQWSCLSACTVGHTHTRERMFIIAYSYEDGESALRIDEALSRMQEISNDIRNEYQNSPLDLRVFDGIPKRLDRSRLEMCGNAVVVQCAELIGRALKEAGF
jgi:DNA (cytosine-5)-methyltransferase 1